MMRSRAGILATAAAGTSLIFHALLFSASRSIRIPIPTGSVGDVESAEMTVVFQPPETEYTIGEAGANGYASHRVDGSREAISREAPVDQAALSLDPVGPDRVVETPQDRAGDVAAAPVSPSAAIARVYESLQARLPEMVQFIRSYAAGPEPVAPAREPAPPEPVATAAAPAAVPAVPVAGGQADPAPMSDSESDPFSVLGSAQYHDGRLSVRAGRKVKSRRPRIGLAGQVDLYQRKGAQVTLRVAIDAAGNVTGVEVVRSSGSNEVDQPCRVAMYDWWFEPKKDAAGTPVPDKFDFTIAFH